MTVGRGPGGPTGGAAVPAQVPGVTPASVFLGKTDSRRSWAELLLSAVSPHANMDDVVGVEVGAKPTEGGVFGVSSQGG